MTGVGGATGSVVFNHTANSTDPDAIGGLGTEITRTSPGEEVSETVWFVFQIDGFVDNGPSNFQDIGKVADAFAPFELNTFTGTTIDTELGLYDADGNLIINNDDAAGVLQSQLDFPTGLAEGFCFLAVGSYNTQFDPVNFEVLLGGAGGAYTLTHPNGLETGVLGAGGFDWYRLEVGSPVGGGGGGGGGTSPIQITSLTYDQERNEFTVAWEATIPGPFLIEMGTAADLAAITPQVNILPEVLAAGITESPITVPVPPGLLSEPQLFLRVYEDSQ